jgi:hypothetical protein
MNYNVRIRAEWEAEDSPDVRYAVVEADTPAAAAMQLFYDVYNCVPEVIELTRTDLAGYPLTSFRLAASTLDTPVRVDVEDRQP